MNTPTKFKALAIYQIGGGIIGLILTAILISKLNIIPVLSGILLFVVIVLYLFSIYCGILLLKKDPAGLNYSLVNQCLQVVSFAIAGFAFQYISGAYMSIGVSLSDSFTLLANFGVSSWQIAINGDSGPVIVVVNLVALVLIIFILRLRKETRVSISDAERQIASLGQQ
jgi:hypothetical protein